MTKLCWMMGKQLYAKGFSLLELMIVVSIISVFLISGAIPTAMFLYQDTQDRIVHTQTIALFSRKGKTVLLDDRIERFDVLRFNAKGNVTVAQTLRFKGRRKIVIMLGPGRSHE